MQIKDKGSSMSTMYRAYMISAIIWYRIYMRKNSYSC